MTRRKGKPHVVPTKGAAVFVPHGEPKGRLAEVRVGGKRLKARLAGEKAPRDLAPDDYAGPPRDAA